jgi:hypothetical protein
MAIERFSDPIAFPFRIKMQHHSRNFAPVRTFRIGIEHSPRHEVLHVVRGQHLTRGRNVGDRGLSGSISAAVLQ